MVGDSIGLCKGRVQALSCGLRGPDVDMKDRIFGTMEVQAGRSVQDMREDMQTLLGRQQRVDTTPKSRGTNLELTMKVFTCLSAKKYLLWV